MQPGLLVGFPDYSAPAQRLAQTANLNYAEIRLHRFPDGESLVTLPPVLPDWTVFCRSLHTPNDKLVELVLAVHQARLAGVKRITLVAPYLCYMRQDTAFEAGQAISQQAVGQLLGELLDDLITVDPHLHRTAELNQVIPACRTVTLNATATMADFIRTDSTLGKAFLLGPDQESEQWVSALATATGLDYAIATKQRLGDRKVHITLPEKVHGQPHLLLVDDMLSSGGTLATTATTARTLGTNTIDCVVTHALCDEAAVARLKNTGIRNLYSCDSVPHSSNRLELAGLLAEALSSITIG